MLPAVSRLLPQIKNDPRTIRRRMIFARLKNAISMLLFCVVGCNATDTAPEGTLYCPTADRIPFHVKDPRSAGVDAAVPQYSEGEKPEGTPPWPKSVHIYTVAVVPLVVGEGAKPRLISMKLEPVEQNYSSGRPLFSRAKIVPMYWRATRSDSMAGVPPRVPAKDLCFLLLAQDEDLGWRILRPTKDDLRTGVVVEDLKLLPRADSDQLGRTCIAAASILELD